jgi:hypothetical protein
MLPRNVAIAEERQVRGAPDSRGLPRSVQDEPDDDLVRLIEESDGTCGIVPVLSRCAGRSEQSL